ncbi:hypothetical protein FISHEDRAFT_69495 [Fistulina hepatica ATCC 64428]|uniref:MYND-type domain-containing protein n=1 Tax=Fistulina hepatica ATCC 64428 TaxID=1128425 RepID=A0A0D7ALN3_9AGAR|nr:hypothetical protein FISHEDRAFT_69495 [Fistulina hepatica ATCC 64428]
MPSGLTSFTEAELDYAAGRIDPCFRKYLKSIKKIIKDEKLDAKLKFSAGAPVPPDHPEELLGAVWRNFIGFFKDKPLNINEETQPDAYKFLKSFIPSSGHAHPRFDATPRTQLLLKGMQVTACFALGLLAWDKRDRATASKRYREGLEVAHTVPSFLDPVGKGWEMYVANEVKEMTSNLEIVVASDEQNAAPGRRTMFHIPNTRVEADGNVTFQDQMMSATDVCAACGKRDVKMKHCGACKAVTYCGPVCQKNHWK